MSYTPLIWALLGCAGLLGAIAIYLRRFQSVSAARPFGWLVLLGMLWTLLYALGISTRLLDLQILISHLQFSAVVLVPNTILIIALEYVGLGHWLTRRRLWLLGVVPMLGLLLEWTSADHVFFHTNYYLDASGVAPVLQMAHGPWFWFYNAYNAGLIVAACGLILGAFYARPLHFENSLIMTVAILLPLMADALFRLGFTPVSGFNFASILLILSSILMIFALSRLRLFDVMPVAHRVVINTIHDLMIVLDSRGQIVDFNLAAQERCGLSKALIGKMPAAIAPPWGEVLQRCSECAAHREEIRVPVDSQELVFELTAAGLLDERQHSLGLLLLLHDVTQINQSQDRLRQLSQAVEQSPAVIVLTNLAGVIEYVNPKFTEVTQYQPEEAVGQNPRVLNSGLTSPQTFDVMWKTISSGHEWVGEFINRKKSGEIYYESARISPIFNPGGAITHYLAVKEDITERKQAEDELHKAYEKLQAQLQEIQTLQTSLREQAIRDPLTGLYNRRYLQESLERELALAQREAYPISLVMVDVDKLKRINDTYGHDAGDLVLQKISGVLIENTRASDILCRMGGDEFLLVMPGLSAEDSYHWAERLRMKLQLALLPPEESQIYSQVTLSIGIAVFPEHGLTSHQVILAADHAAYQAKASGRDRVVVWQAPSQV